MESLMVIDTAKSGIVFPLAYLAAFLFVAGIMIFEGFRKGYPKNAWLLILLTGVLFFIIGDKLFAYSPEQWGQVFTRFQFPYSDKKTLFGGITGLFAGMYLAKTWLRFNRPVLDTMALALPVAIAISCIGCLMAGCCFGTPTNLPWGVQYGETSWAFHVHQTCGLVHPASATSLTIHPVQLYQAIGCLAVAVIVLMSRKYWKSSGSLFLVSVLGYLAIRFFIEFVRAPETNSFAGQFFFGLKVNQWFIAATFIAGLFILLIRERKWEPAPVKSQLTGPTEFRLFTLTAVISLVILLTRNWFTSLEYSTLICFSFRCSSSLHLNFITGIPLKASGG